MNTTLVYIEKGEEVLMLHRVRKSGDINAGKWIGVGGKFEEGESPEACMRREVFEETGLQVDEYRYAAVVTFSCDDDYELMHLFLVTRFHGELQTCAEGDLEWLPKSQLTEIPHWSGDRIFLSLLFGKPRPFFSLKMVYASSRFSGLMRTEIPQLAEMNLGTGMIVTSAGLSSFSVEIAA